MVKDSNDASKALLVHNNTHIDIDLNINNDIYVHIDTSINIEIDIDKNGKTSTFLLSIDNFTPNTRSV